MPSKIRPLSAAIANRDGPRILFVDQLYPRPDNDSGSVTVRYLIEIFLQLGWQVTFFADREPHGAKRYTADLEGLGVRCLRKGDRILERFLMEEGRSLSLCMLFRVFAGGSHFELVRRHAPDAKIVFETVDLHFLREERQARLEKDQLALNQARATRERELYLCRSSDLAIVVSDFERNLLEKEVPGVRVMTLPLILECPGRTQPFERRAGVAFIGGYLHQPNVDAVRYFLAEIWPKVVERLPTCAFHIVGSNMPDEFKNLAGPNLLPVGYVADIDEYLGKVRLTVAPLRYGAGVKGKVGSSLANGVPCVGSPIAVEGMGLGADAVAVAADPTEFAERIVAIHEDQATWMRMSDEGWEHASSQLSLDAARGRIAEMLGRLNLPVPRPAGAIPLRARAS